MHLSYEQKSSNATPNEAVRLHLARWESALILSLKIGLMVNEFEELVEW